MAARGEVELLQSCADRLGSTLAERDERALRRWWTARQGQVALLVRALSCRPEAEWGRVVDAHRAHRHPWYERLEAELDVRECAAFLLENRAYPPSLPLLERLLHAQICGEARAAIHRQMADEQLPVPRAELMRRVLAAVTLRAGEGLPLDCSARLADSTLVVYYGYYCDPWHLAGALYATELMARHHVTKLGAGLARLGLTEHELELVRVHSAGDERRARDWLEAVILPSLRLYSRLRTSVVTGIAACLETSAVYLDERCRRADARAGAPAATLPVGSTSP
jgi:hypothetical protein